MQSKKINELGTSLSPSVNDLTVVGDASTGQLKKITLSQIAALFGSSGSVSSIATTAPLTGGTITTSGTLGITQATTSANGYLSSSDWNLFNGKQAALSGTGFIKISGTTVSYDNSSYYLSSNPSSFITLSSLSGNSGVSYNNTTGVISSTITQYTDALARASLSFTAGNASYNNITGVITIPTNNTQLTNGAGYITSSALSSYVPYTGATGTVNLGTNILGAGVVSLTGTASNTNQASGATYIYLQGGGSSFTTIQQAVGKLSFWQFDGSIFNNTFNITNAGASTFSGTLTANGISIGASDVRSNSNILTLGGTSEVIRIVGSTGNVGIGTSSPTSILDIRTTASTTGSILNLSNTTGAASGNIVPIRFYTGNTFGGLEQVAAIWAYNDNAGTNNGGSLLFATSNNGTATTPTVKMRLDNDGQLNLAPYHSQAKFCPGGDVNQYLRYNTSVDGMELSGYSGVMFSTVGGTERMRITSTGIINTTSRLNVNGAIDNSLFSLSTNGTLYTVGFSPNMTYFSSTTLTMTTGYTTYIYNGSGTATWTLPTPTGTNQMFWIKNLGTGTITLNAYSGTNIINNSGTSVTSITISIGATVLIQQDGFGKSIQLQ